VNNRVNPLGLFDLDRKIRPVGRAYQKLIHDWRHVLPTQSVCLRVPLALPEEQRRAWEKQAAHSERRDAPAVVTKEN